MATLFKEIYINKSVIEKIYLILNKLKYKDNSKGTYTINGFQTPNIFKHFNQKLLKEILPIEGFHKKIFHLHYIKYKENGFQHTHNHEKTEKYSFILYLNDSDGDTLFGKPINRRIMPEARKLIFFDSSILHRAEMSYKGKEILVGGVDKNVL